MGTKQKTGFTILITIELCIFALSGIYLFQLYLNKRDVFETFVGRSILHSVYNLSARCQHATPSVDSVDFEDKHRYKYKPYSFDENMDLELRSLYDTRDTSRWNLKELDLLVQKKPPRFQQKYNVGDLSIYYKIVDTNNHTLAEFKNGTKYRDLASIREEIELGIESGHFLRVQYEFPFYFFFRENLSQLLYTGIVFIFLVICTVILYRLLQVEKKRSWYHRQFTYGILHDLKTPINNAQKALYLYEHNDPKAPFTPEECMRDIREELATLNNNTSRLLHLSVNVQGVKLNKAPIDIVRLLHETADYYSRNSVEGKNVRFSFHGDTASMQIQADINYLPPVFQNLIDNSIKYSDEEVHIEFFYTEKKDRIEIVVRDNGWGMPPDSKKYVFKTNYRNHHHTQIKGYGLGLQYVYLIVKAHKGRIWFNSKQRKGTEFIIILPKT